MEKWEGKVAVVTGASSGIGRDLSIKLANYGMKVAALARRVDRLEELSNNFTGKGEIVGYECDITDSPKVEEVFGRISAEMGPVHVLVNNAGIGLRSNFGDLEIDKWRKMFDLNVFGLFDCTKQVINEVKKNNSEDLVHIININSVAGVTTFESMTDIYPYASTKQVLTYLTKGLMKQMVLDKLNVRITSLHPGVVRTEFFDAGDFYGELFSQAPGLEGDNVADACIAILSAEPNVLISSMVIKPMGEIY